MPFHCLVALLALLLGLSLPSRSLAQWPMQPDLAQPSLRGLVSWWMGAPGLVNSTTLYDLVPATRQNGTLTNMGYASTSGWSPSTRSGGVAQLNFDGVDDWVDLTTNSLYDFANTAFTVTLWYKAPTQASATYLLARRISGGAQGGWMIRLNTTGTIEARINDAGNTSAAARATTGTGYTDGTWRHLAVVFLTDTTTGANNDVHLYVNAVQDEGSLSSNTGAPYALCGCKLVIGALADQAAGSFLTGSVDDVRIFNRALTQGDLLGLYQQGLQLPASSTDGLAAVLAAPLAGAPGSFLPFFR